MSKKKVLFHLQGTLKKEEKEMINYPKSSLNKKCV